MTNARISTTKKLSGTVRVPPSKSWTHRALICGLLSDGLSEIRNPLQCDDTAATTMACQSFGAQIETDPSSLKIRGVANLHPASFTIDCKASGATLRFFLPIAALCQGSSRFSLDKSLRERPIEPLARALRGLGARVAERDGQIEIHGVGLHGGEVYLPGNLSSQFVSGCLLAFPRGQGAFKIRLESALESAPYVQMTIQCLARHNVVIQHSPDLTEFTVSGKQRFVPTHYEIAGDYSAASFLIAAASSTGSTITLEGIPEDPLQGDSEILEIAERMGARIDRKDSTIIVKGGRDRLLPIDVDVRQTPDIVPPIVAMASRADGDSKISGVGRLQYKESNRIERLLSEFGKLGAEAKAVDDSLVISGTDSLRGARVDPAGDHRIAMALAVAGLRARGETEIIDAGCVSKSYPDFFHDLAGLGGRVTF